MKHVLILPNIGTDDLVGFDIWGQGVVHPVANHVGLGEHYEDDADLLDNP